MMLSRLSHELMYIYTIGIKLSMFAIFVYIFSNTKSSKLTSYLQDEGVF